MRVGAMWFDGLMHGRVLFEESVRSAKDIAVGATKVPGPAERHDRGRVLDGVGMLRRLRSPGAPGGRARHLGRSLEVQHGP